jgi:hypothetical protein
VITGHELIECVTAMSDTERREIATLLLAAVYADPCSQQLAGMSGIEMNWAIAQRMTVEQQEELRRICYTGQGA